MIREKHDTHGPRPVALLTGPARVAPPGSSAHGPTRLPDVGPCDALALSGCDLSRGLAARLLRETPEPSSRIRR